MSFSAFFEFSKTSPQFSVLKTITEDVTSAIGKALGKKTEEDYKREAEMFAIRQEENKSYLELLIAMESDDAEKIKYLLSGQVYGEENLLNAVDSVFKDDFNVVKTIWSFLRYLPSYDLNADVFQFPRAVQLLITGVLPPNMNTLKSKKMLNKIKKSGHGSLAENCVKGKLYRKKIFKLISQSPNFDPNFDSPNFPPLLHTAIMNKHSDAIKILISRGASPKSRKGYRSALTAAITDRNVQILDILSEHNLIDDMDLDDSKNNRLYFDIYARDLERVQFTVKWLEESKFYSRGPGMRGANRNLITMLDADLFHFASQLKDVDDIVQFLQDKRRTHLQEIFSSKTPLP